MAEENNKSKSNTGDVVKAPKSAKTSKKGVSTSKKKDHKDAHKKAESHSKSVSGSMEKSKEVPWKLVAIILGVIMLLLIAGFAVYSLMNSNNNSDDMKNVNSTQNANSNNANSDKIELLVVEDSTCTTCDVDGFAQQVKANLIPTLELSKISYDSTDGKKIVEELKAVQVPIYLFGNNIDKREDWINLSGAFDKVTVNGNSYYMLNPQFVQNKVMIESPVILPTAVTVGNPDAKVTIIEFSDYECPYCGIAEGNEELLAQFAAQSPGYVPPMPSVFKDYIDTGKVKLVFYNLPLTQIHKNALSASNAALCANEQGKWREFHENLFLDRDSWVNEVNPKAAYDKFATDLKLDITKFDECYDESKYQSQIDTEMQLAQTYGISGTPAFFVGKNFISGAQDYTSFKAIVDAELAK